MRNTFLTFFCLFGLALTANSQSLSDNALGIRIGGSDGYGVEVSYQRAIAQSKRLEFNLGVRSADNYDGFKLTTLHQWVWKLDGNFNWYAGAGGGIGAYDYDNVPSGRDDTETFFFIAGNLGIEYDFDFPLVISLDVRPEIGFGDFNNDFDFDLGLGLRYQF